MVEFGEPLNRKISVGDWMKNIIFLCFLLCVGSSSYAVVFATFANNKLIECKMSDASLDEFVSGLNQRFNTKCELLTGIGSMVKGFIYHCGQNNTQMLFREIKDCELVKSAVNNGTDIKPEAFAPLHVKNPTGWVVAIDSCMNKAVNTASIEKAGLQKLSDYCSCTAKKTAAYFEKELNAALATSFVKECLSDQQVKLSPETEKKIDKLNKKSIESVREPKRGKNSIKVNQDLFVYDHWFFSGKNSDINQLSYIKTVPLKVTAGEAFGFRALFSAKKEDVHLRVELHVPDHAERFPSHTGNVTISADNKLVTVSKVIAGKAGSTSFYWGVGKGDPQGRYELKYYLDDVAIETFTFTVEGT